MYRLSTEGTLFSLVYLLSCVLVTIEGMHTVYCTVVVLLFQLFFENNTVVLWYGACLQSYLWSCDFAKSSKFVRS